MAMQTGELKMRFGRCPYCRAMVYQDPKEVIVFCSKCRTPIRGKNPVPTEEIDQALGRLEILSVDTASVFSDELDACHNQLAPVIGDDGDQSPLFSETSVCFGLNTSPYGGFSPARRVHSPSNGAFNGARCDDGLVNTKQQEQLLPLPLSRRTRRPLGSDSSVLGYGALLMPTESETVEGFSNPGEQRRRRRPLLGSREFPASIGLFGREPRGAAPSPLRDPAFHMELLRALDTLRGLIAAVEPASGRAAPRRDDRTFRGLESQLALALQLRATERLGPRRNAGSAGSSTSSSCAGAGGRSTWRKERSQHCRPVLGGAPFLVCGSCSELLRAPAATALLPRRKVARLRCGGCEELVVLASPFVARTLSAPPVSEPPSQRMPPQPLHRALGYSSPSPLLQSRRY